MSGKPFRPHLPHQQLLTGIYRRLVDEWVRECDLPVARHLRLWGRQHPCLAGLAGLPDVLDRVDAAAEDEADELLLALISLTQGGSQLAGRVLLQLLLPKLNRIAGQGVRTHGQRWRSSEAVVAGDDDVEERRQAGIAAFYEVLASYPVTRRPHRVAANLAMDTLSMVTPPRGPRIPEDAPNAIWIEGYTRASSDREVAGHWRWVGSAWNRASAAGVASVASVDPADLEVILDGRSEVDAHQWSTRACAATTVTGGTDHYPCADRADAGFDLDSGIVEVIAWALDAQVLTSDEAALLVRVYAGSGEESPKDVAEALGLSYAALRQRCARATRKLIPAARQYAESVLIGDSPAGVDTAV